MAALAGSVVFFLGDGYRDQNEGVSRDEERRVSVIYLGDLRGTRKTDASGAVHQLLACDTTTYPQERDTLVGFAPSGRRGDRWENVRESRR